MIKKYLQFIKENRNSLYHYELLLTDVFDELSIDFKSSLVNWNDVLEVSGTKLASYFRPNVSKKGLMFEVNDVENTMDELSKLPKTKFITNTYYNNSSSNYFAFILFKGTDDRITPVEYINNSNVVDFIPNAITPILKDVEYFISNEQCYILLDFKYIVEEIVNDSKTKILFDNRIDLDANHLQTMVGEDFDVSDLNEDEYEQLEKIARDKMGVIFKQIAKDSICNFIEHTKPSIKFSVLSYDKFQLEMDWEKVDTNIYFKHNEVNMSDVILQYINRNLDFLKAFRNNDLTLLKKFTSKDMDYQNFKNKIITND